MKLKQKRTLLFDNETTGLLKPDAQSVNEQPYIIEFHGTVLLHDFEKDTITIDKEFGTLIRPPVPISAKITEITGITNDDVEDAPSFAEVYMDIANLFHGCHRMVAHNLDFDRKMVANELLRIDKLLALPWPIEHVCTVEASLSIEGYRLNLDKLHRKATGDGFSGAHRAKEDVYAVIRCYHWLCEQGLIKP